MTRITKEAARDIWNVACANNGDVSVNYLVRTLKELHEIVPHSANDPLGSFIAESGAKHVSEGHQVDGVNACAESRLVCQSRLDADRAVLRHLLGEIKQTLAVPVVLGQELDGAAGNSGNDDVRGFFWFEGRLVEIRVR